jgi:phage gp37-like protein
MQIACVEDAIIAKVKDVFGNKLRAVDSLPADVDDETLKRLVRTTPGVYVVFDGGMDQTQGGSQAKVRAQFSVNAITSHVSGEKARRRGDKLEIGAYDIIEILLPKLHRMTVKGIGTLVFQNIENRYDGPLDKLGVAVYAAVYYIDINFPDIDAVAVLAPFKTASVTTKPAPLSNPVTDVIELQQ